MRERERERERERVCVCKVRERDVGRERGEETRGEKEREGERLRITEEAKRDCVQSNMLIFVKLFKTNDCFYHHQELYLLLHFVYVLGISII